MGNQSSREKQTKADEAHIRQLVDYLTVGERDNLLKQFGGKDSVSSKTIDVSTFIETCTNNLPGYFNKPLAQSFGCYVAAHGTSTTSVTLTFRQCLDTIISISHGTTLVDGTMISPADAFIDLYTLAAREHTISLATFVTWIVETGVRIWFEGSGRTFVDNNQQQLRLVNNILHFTKVKQRTAEELDWLLDEEDQKATKSSVSINTGATLQWAQQVESVPFEQLENDTTKQILKDWFESTNELALLFQLVAKMYFFGQELNEFTGDSLHHARVSHRRSPSIQAAPDTTFSRLLSPYDYFYLSMQFPQNALSWSSHERIQRRQAPDHDLQHQNIFSSRHNGNSWQVFANGITRNQGATLLVIKTKDGSLFGGYADDLWRLETDWYGTSTNYLFQLDGSFSSYNMMGLWNATSNNRHYQYLCWGKKSLSNGLGMGGQLDYAGLWIDADFIHGHSKGPICSTYQSPRLSLQDQFEIDEVEVWLIRPVIRDEDEDDTKGGSVLDRAEDMEFLEMSGRKLYSRDLEKPPQATGNEDNNK